MMLSLLCLCLNRFYHTMDDWEKESQRQKRRGCDIMMVHVP
ncbi:hypothetical protein B4113_1935 [Geobacillus sp. B4113_201601]|nr:hypothetical protein B4113_1935 [Geobacillus sp. B4113_201601]